MWMRTSTGIELLKFKPTTDNFYMGYKSKCVDGLITVEETKISYQCGGV